MTDLFLDGEHTISAKILRNSGNVHAQILSRIEVIPGVFMQTTHHGHIWRDRHSKWVFKGRRFNTPEGAAIAAFMALDEPGVRRL